VNEPVQETGCSIEREVRIVDPDLFQRCDDAIEIGDVRHGTDSYTIHAAASDDIIANEHLSIAPTLKLLRQALCIGGVGEGARLNEQCGNRRGSHGSWSDGGSAGRPCGRRGNR